MISKEQAGAAVVDMRICRYFPAEDYMRTQVAMILIEMVNTKQELDWLTMTQVKMGEWKGVGELRGLFCARYSPRDGIDAESETPGYRVSDIEMQYIERQSRETDRMLAAAKAEQKLLGGDVATEPVDIASTVKPIPEPAKQSRLEQDILAGRERVVDLYVPGTRKRTAEENAALIEETRQQVEARRKAAK